jgi:hypothetical protein
MLGDIIPFIFNNRRYHFKKKKKKTEDIVLFLTQGRPFRIRLLCDTFKYRLRFIHFLFNVFFLYLTFFFFFLLTLCWCILTILRYFSFFFPLSLSLSFTAISRSRSLPQAILLRTARSRSSARSGCP